MQPRRIVPSSAAVRARFDAVPSKSATHRALVVAALATGRSLIQNPLHADDTRITREGLRALGVRVEECADGWEIQGAVPPGGGRIELGESGTSFRFLVALAALGRAPSFLNGKPRLRERPIRELTAGLSALGGNVQLPAEPASLPITAGGRPLRGGRVRLPAGRSSQFASALLLIGSRLPSGLELELVPPVVSLPYVRMTLDVLRDFGVDVAEIGPTHWTVGPTDYPGRRFRIEGDHSSASYLLAAPALVGGQVRVDGLRPASAQPDARLGALLRGLGCRVRTGDTWIEVEGDGVLTPFDLDMAEAPDLVPTLAVLALAADGPCVLRGIAHLRWKESDRLEALARNLSALGRPAEAVEDRLEIGGRSRQALGAGVTLIRTCSDHRMAMAFALAGLRVPGIVVDDADCVTKSNPGFWAQFDGL